ncbi:MAG: manganese efflux pump MntP family protein [Oscillospiraceae bacterium]|nr:manganese efflux pump MntP family protein [Oscillospiraceae bacterium]
MQLWELFLIAVSLSMDAFAVSVCKGLSVKQVRPKHALVAGAYFGGFQMLMPLIGYFLGGAFESLITGIDHWIAFVLLGLIGANMVKESRGESENLNDSFSFRAMLPLAVATSIDALAVGVTFAFLQVDILAAVCLIGATTFLFSAGGVHIGNRFGVKYKSRAELAGGIVLILMGLKILVEHLLTHAGILS